MAKLVTSHACFIHITSEAIMHYTVQKMNTTWTKLGKLSLQYFLTFLWNDGVSVSLTTFISQDVKWKGLARRSKYLITENYRIQVKKSMKMN